MNTCIVRRSTLAAGALAGLVLLAGCQDKRVKEMQTGITRDSVMSMTAQGTVGSDSMPSIYKRDTYLIDGKTLEVLYFDSQNRKIGKDTVPLAKLTPLVMWNGNLVGKGWAAWDSIAASHKIPITKR